MKEIQEPGVDELYATTPVERILADNSRWKIKSDAASPAGNRFTSISIVESSLK